MAEEQQRDCFSNFVLLGMTKKEMSKCWVPVATTTQLWEFGKTGHLLGDVSQASGTMSAINLCILSTLANAACLSTSGKLLTEKVDVLRLTFYISPICAAFILPFTLYFEVRILLLKQIV